MMPEATVTNEESAYRVQYYKGLTSVKKRDLFCSSCGNTISFGADNYNSHPFLGILQCQACCDQFRLLKSSLKIKSWKKRCLMCGSNRCQTLFPCPVNDCPYSFCKNCIKRNAASALLLADTANWKCFVCMTNPLWAARGVCATLLAESPRRKKKQKMVREVSSDDDDIEDIRAQLESQKNSGLSRKLVTTSSSSSSLTLRGRRPTQNASKSSVNQTEEDTDGDIEIVSVKKSKKSSKPTTTRSSSRQMSSERSSVERSMTPEPSRNRSKLTRTQPSRRTRTGSSESKTIFTHRLTESLRRQNSDSSSGKEFTQTKLIKESYVTLQRLAKDYTHSPEQSSSPVASVLTKQQVFSLKTSIQEFIKNLRTTSNKMLESAESLHRQYSQRETIKPLEATTWIAQCKNTASSFRKQIDDNEHMLVDKFGNWCKKTKVQNIFISTNGINDTTTPSRSGLDTTKPTKQVILASSSDEEANDPKSHVSKASSSSIDRTPEVSDCDSEIFTQDEEAHVKSRNERKKKLEEDKSLSPIHEEMNGNTSDFQQQNTSSSSRKSRTAEALVVVDDDKAQRIELDESSTDMFADLESDVETAPHPDEKEHLSDSGNMSDEVISSGPKSSKKSGGKKIDKLIKDSRAGSPEYLPLPDDSDDEQKVKRKLSTASATSSPEKKTRKSQDEMKKSRRFRVSQVYSDTSSDEDVKRKSEKLSESKNRIMKASTPVVSDVDTSDDEEQLVESIDKQKANDAKAEAAAKAILMRSSSSSDEEIVPNSSHKPTRKVSTSASVVATDSSEDENFDFEKSKNVEQTEDSSPELCTAADIARRSLLQSYLSPEVKSHESTEKSKKKSSPPELSTAEVKPTTAVTSDTSFYTAQHMESSQSAEKSDKTESLLVDPLHVEESVENSSLHSDASSGDEVVKTIKSHKNKLESSADEETLNESIKKSKKKKASSTEVSDAEDRASRLEFSSDELDNTLNKSADKFQNKALSPEVSDAEERAKKILLKSDTSSNEGEMDKSDKSDKTIDKSRSDVSDMDETTKDSVLEPDDSSDKAADETVLNDLEHKAKEALLQSSSEENEPEETTKPKAKASKSDSSDAEDSPDPEDLSRESVASGSRDPEEEARDALLKSSSEDEDEDENDKKRKLPPTESLDGSDRDSQNTLSSPRVKRRRLNIKNSTFYKADRKLRVKCWVALERLPNRKLRRHARALKQSKEYLEDKELKSLTTLNRLEKIHKRDRGNGSDSSDTTSTCRMRKKTSKEAEETLMDHLNVNGEKINTDDSSSDDTDDTETREKFKLSCDLQQNAEKLAKNALLASSDDEKPIDLSSDDEVIEKNKKKSDEKPTDKSPTEAEGASKSSKGDWRRSKLLTMKLSSSDEDEQSQKFDKKVQKLSQKDSDDSDLEDEGKKKKRVRRRRLNSDSDIKLTDEEPSDDSNDPEDTKKMEKKGKRRLKKMGNSSDSSSSTTKSRPKPKRRRVRTAGTDSDSDVEEINNSQGSPNKSGRKNIRKVIKDKQVADDTKQAAKQEEERLKRMAERQKLYNEMYEARLAGEEKVDDLILDFDEESKEELLSVHEGLVKRLKPHQAQGIKFMWDACYESLERATSTKGSGCILAHCMGLGKSFQAVTLTHTLLVNTEKTGVRTALVVCPLSTVLNWVNEFKIWLKEVNDGDDVEVYELTRLKKNQERKFQLERWHKHGGVMIIGYEMYRNLSNPTKKINKKLRESFFKCLVAPGPDLVICDEGHLLKSETTAISKAMSNITTLRRIVLTGTPLQNNLTEYHCMVQFVKPNLLGTKREFLNRFVNPIQNGQFDNSTEYDVKLMKKRAHVLHKMLEGSVQRFDYSVLTPFLPPKQEYVIFVKLSAIQVQLYQYYIDNLARRHKGAGGSLFADFQALQRVWTHPFAIKLNADKAAEKKMNEDTDSEGSLKDFIDDGSDDDSTSSDSTIASTSSSKSKKSEVKRHTRADGDTQEVVEEPVPDPTEWWTQFVEDEHFEDLRISAKLRILFEILKESENIGDKVLVFSQSLYSLTLIEKFLAIIDDETQKGNSSELIDEHTGSWSPGLDYFRLDGQTSSENRNHWCKIFNKPTNTRARLFLISTRAGGLGINLTAANRVIIFDASWNPSHDVQSIFRIYRFGQKKPCYVYRLLASGTMEEKIYNRQVTKLSLSCRVVDEQQIERHYTNSDLAELYTFDPPKETTETIGCPKDRLLAEIFSKHKTIVSNFHEHDSLLENKADEELDEEERKQAWLEYEQEKAGKPPVNPMMNAGFSYQDQMLQQFNQQVMNTFSFANGNSVQNELNNLHRLYQKDFPNMTDEQQKMMATKALMDMYTYVESQTVVSARAGNPLMPAAAAPSYSNPTQTLANQLAQEAYTRHHQHAKQLTAYQKQLLYAQQYGNLKSIAGSAPRAPQNSNMYARQPTATPQRATASSEPDVVEIIPGNAAANSTAAQSSSAQSKPTKYQEE